jgi:adenosylmethionine---8-amino-7-oxononanoate aminotransferase
MAKTRPRTVLNWLEHSSWERRCFSSFSSSLTEKKSDDAPKPTALEPYLHPAVHTARCSSTRDHLNWDRRHIWHPYTSLSDPPPVLAVSHATGCTLVLEKSLSSNKENTVLLDGMSSWWAAVWGYNHPVLNAAIHEQLGRMSHVMFGGLTHRPATELAALLLHMLRQPQGDATSLSPPNETTTTRNDAEHALSKVFYTDSGSVAVEVALKMAVQYHRGVQHRSKKTKIVSVRGGYHGDTLGAMSVCDPVNGMHTAFRGMVPEQFFVARPPCDAKFRLGRQGQQQLNESSLLSSNMITTGWCSGCTCQLDGEDAALDLALEDLQRCLEKNHDILAALILEPIVQGAGGMRFYSPKYLQRARELCTEYNVLLVCDEIATGFGRSGGDSSPFASLEAGVSPDILCIGKALTGGYMTLGAVITTDAVARGISSSPPSLVDTAVPDEVVLSLPLMHGPTFMGNPLACAVAVASTNLMMEPDLACPNHSPMWKSSANRIERELCANLSEALEIPGVADVRVRGAIGVIELHRPVDSAKVVYRCRELGVWLRPFGKLLYTMPPYIMTNEELRRVTDAMLTLAAENESY